MQLSSASKKDFMAFAFARVVPFREERVPHLHRLIGSQARVRGASRSRLLLFRVLHTRFEEAQL